MYKTTRSIAGETLMRCKDCGHEISMNKMCERPIQAATDMLKHIAAHNALRAITAVENAMQTELSPTLSASQQQETASGSQLPN